MAPHFHLRELVVVLSLHCTSFRITKDHHAACSQENNPSICNRASSGQEPASKCQIVDADMPPATSWRPSAAFASSTKIDTTKQTTQLRTSDSKMSALIHSRSPSLVQCSMCFVGSTNDLTFTRSPNQGQEEDFMRQQQGISLGAWCCIRRGRRRPCQTWRRLPYGFGHTQTRASPGSWVAEGLSISTAETSKPTTASSSKLNRRPASTHDGKTKSAAKHKKQGPLLEWNNSSKFEQIPQLR